MIPPVTRLLFLSTVATVAQSQCYWPKGGIALGHQPCNKDTGQCCFVRNNLVRDTCFDNGLCASKRDGFYYRASCAHMQWDPGAGCKNPCGNYNAKGGSRVTPCSDRMCCGDPLKDNNTLACCKKGTGFKFGDAAVINLPVTDCSAYTLSRDTTIGISIGVPTVVLTAIMLWMKCFKKRRFKRRKDTASDQSAVQKHQSTSNVSAAPAMSARSFHSDQHLNAEPMTPQRCDGHHSSCCHSRNASFRTERTQTAVDSTIHSDQLPPRVISG